eukprot:TRINITY_DN27658_c0_g1_i1.p1 TRINITY_DN27658_c0_g1~~TRINITY_DN27658_c0_g1_i1.p1  ORF type:complete len:361 (-),score=106.32 TRINITY_DN27658_c0_g1_i1:103-1185(-)
MDSLDDLLNCVEVLDKSENEDDSKVYPWKRAKKVACIVSFSGKNYHGMQRNPGDDINTIEDELMAALSKSGAIDPEWEKVPQKAFFKRASRTDKGVSAARMVISLKMLPDRDIVAKMNSFLPPDIRMQGMVRATRNFNCQTHADGRTYLYLIPTFAFCTSQEEVAETWRCGPDTIGQVNSVLQHFVGSHYFHNYTSGKLPMEPASRRFIQEFEAGEPFEREGVEWSVIRVRGQSFMLHQIRKMVGLMIAIVRGDTGMQALEDSWGQQRIDIPMAPGLGLMLDMIHYERYNKRYWEEGMHDNLDWAEHHDQVEKFKEKFIFSDIIKTEVKEKSMMKWLREVLPMHTFMPRNFENQKENIPA